MNENIFIYIFFVVLVSLAIFLKGKYFYGWNNKVVVIIIIISTIIGSLLLFFYFKIKIF